MLHRRLPGGKRLTHLHAIAEITRDPSRFVVVMKSAQVGLSEAGINLALHAADSGLGERGNVLYAMPTQNMMDDFSQARIDAALQHSPYLRGRLLPQPPARKGADSKRLKSLGRGHLYLRGTESARQIASMDLDLVILDEFDQMADGILTLAEKRLASSEAPRLRVMSTPRFPEAGIDELYRHSDQRRYLLPCPHCALEQFLKFEANVDQERRLLVCRGCGKEMNVRAKGRWEAQAPGNAYPGYSLSRLYSYWVDIGAMVDASQATGIKATQEFYNSDLGEPFSPPGGGLTLEELDRARYNYRLAPTPARSASPVSTRAGSCTSLSAASGSGSRTTSASRPSSGGPATWRTSTRPSGSCGSTTSSPAWSMPTRSCMVPRASPRCQRARSRWRVTTGSRSGTTGRAAIQPSSTSTAPRRWTKWPSASAPDSCACPLTPARLGGRVKDGIGDYYRQVMAPQRLIELDSNGNPRAVWREGHRDDHFAHAEVYCERAQELKPALMPMPYLGVGGWAPSKWR